MTTNSKRNLISNGNPMEITVGFSRAMGVGSFIAVGGTAPVDETGKTVGVGDVFVQTTQCFKIIEAALIQAGSGLEDIVRTRVILPTLITGRRQLKRASRSAQSRALSILSWRSTHL